MSISFWPAIQQITGGPVGSPGLITRDSQWTIVIVDTSQNGGVTDIYCQLPSDSEVGDVVEVHNINNGGNAVVALAPSGEETTGVLPAAKHFYRKITSTVWGYV